MNFLLQLVVFNGFIEALDGFMSMRGVDLCLEDSEENKRVGA